MKAHENREAWLLAAVDALAPLLDLHGVGERPEVLRVSYGWPGDGSRHTRIGECWAETCSADGAVEMSISPMLSEPGEVLAVLVHEMVHAWVGVQHGHRGPFGRLARAVGLVGKLTATEAGEVLGTDLAAVARDLGPYPHGAMSTESGRKRQTTRMIKCECSDCGYVLRTTRKWIEVAVPECPCGCGMMDVG